MPNAFWENLNVTPRWVSSLEIHKTSPVIARKQPWETEASGWCKHIQKTRPRSSRHHVWTGARVKNQVILVRLRLFEMLMPSAIRLPGNHCRIIRKQGAEALCFKQLLYIKGADNGPNRQVPLRKVQLHFFSHMAWMQLARALNWGSVDVSCVHFHIRNLREGQVMGASWLTGSSCESQQDTNTCFPELEARLWPSMKERWRVFAGIMSDWWAPSCATSINNSFAQFEWGERFTNVKAGYVYFFWKTHFSCICIQCMDISMHMPKDQTCHKHLMSKLLVLVLISFSDFSLE